LGSEPSHAGDARTCAFGFTIGTDFKTQRNYDIEEDKRCATHDHTPKINTYHDLRTQQTKQQVFDIQQ
jgi:hypothetical protein